MVAMLVELPLTHVLLNETRFRGTARQGDIVAAM